MGLWCYMQMNLWLNFRLLLMCKLFREVMYIFSVCQVVYWFKLVFKLFRSASNYVALISLPMSWKHSKLLLPYLVLRCSGNESLLWKTIQPRAPHVNHHSRVGIEVHTFVVNQVWLGRWTTKSACWRQRKQNSGKVANPKWVSPFVKRHSKLHRDKELLRCQFPRIGNWHTSDLISRPLAFSAYVRKRTYSMCIITVLTSVQIMHRLLQVQKSCKFSRNRTRLTLLAIHSKSNCKKHGLWKLVQGCVKRI